MKETKFKVWTGSQMLDSGFSINPHGRIYDIHKTHQPHWVARQFTSFQDKEGTDIYEGDVFECHDRTYDLVRHVGGCYELHERGSDKIFFLFRHHSIIRIIGNSHETQELGADIAV